jgi:hypothetical protein
VAGRQVVDGIDAIKITGQTRRLTLTLFADPATYLPNERKVTAPYRTGIPLLPSRAVPGG